MSNVPVFEAEALKNSSIRHGFFGRSDDASSDVYAEAMGITAQNLIGIHQIHSARAVHAKRQWQNGMPKADALVSATPGLALRLLSADCAPILLADPVAGVIGAAHAGWRGALDGVIMACLEAMRDLGAKPVNIRAAIGPCIAQTSYEVGSEFLQSFIKTDPAHECFFVRGKADHWHFDLKAFCLHQLRNAGVEKIEVMPQDTCAQENEFFSYRRATLRGESDYGRNISAIVLQPRAETGIDA